MELKKEQIEELKRLARNEVTTSGTLNVTLLSLLRSRSPDESFNILGALADAVVAITAALAERALEPQGKAQPELPQPPEGKSFVEWALPEAEYVPDFGLAMHADEVKQYGQECYDAGRTLNAKPLVLSNWKAFPDEPIPSVWMRWANHQIECSVGPDKPNPNEQLGAVYTPWIPMFDQKTIKTYAADMDGWKSRAALCQPAKEGSEA